MALTAEGISLLWHKYFEATEENRELKTQLLEKDELISKLRRALNNVENKLLRLQLPVAKQLSKHGEQLPVAQQEQLSDFFRQWTVGQLLVVQQEQLSDFFRQWTSGQKQLSTKEQQLSTSKPLTPIRLLEQKTDIAFEIFTIDDLFTDKEIEDMKTYIENASNDERTFTYSPFKNGKVVDKEMSTKIYKKLCDAEGIPDCYKDRKGYSWELKGSSMYIFYAKLLPGQKFPIHTDTGSEFGEGGESKFTVLTYLNDDYTGGCTQFYNYSFEKTVSITPKKGRTLIFDIDTFHAGEEVNGTKYWFGTEIVYRKI
jgi:hypothetical protein